MDIEAIVKAWQSQKPPRPAEDEDTLVQRAIRNSRKLDRGVFWRDVRESVVAVALAVLCIVLAHTLARREWPMYAAALCLMWIPFFLVADRRRQPKPRADATTVEAIEESLQRVDHQIWLLRKVVWWYLLPCGLAFLFISGEACFQVLQEDRLLNYGPFLKSIGWCTALYIGIYFLNQWAVRSPLMPLKRELEAALKELRRDA